MKQKNDPVFGWQWHQQDHMQKICMLLQRDNHTDTSSLNFYMPDALPDGQHTNNVKALIYHWEEHASVLLNVVTCTVTK